MYRLRLNRLRQHQNCFSLSWRFCLPLTATLFLVWSYAAVAQDLSNSGFNELKRLLDTLWVVFTAFLVFFMNAGFGMLETGFCRQKNAVNILSKNLIVFALATVAYSISGFALMFSDGGYFNPVLGTQGFFFSGRENDYNSVFSSLDWANVPLNAKFFFQLAFAGTAATIVSGAVAERIKFLAFFIFSILLVGVSYPITGHWVWGGGWLQTKIGFYDFAGSTVVHSVGGWAALMGAILIGPRLGKYRNGQSFALPGHNLSMSTLGCLILWLGWFGFNPGSTMAADPMAITHIILTTNMAAATGAMAAMLTSWWYFGKPDLSMIVNGILAGLVAITAACAFVSLGSSVVIGLIAGTIVVFSVELFDRWKIDDPVGAISVHLVCGIWGTLAVGLFSEGIGSIYSQGPEKGLFFGGGFNQLIAQLCGILTIGIFTAAFSLVAWSTIKIVLGSLRVEPEKELRGLDLSEHALRAYSDFVLQQDGEIFRE
ncbi:MAG: ammonium transporter [Symploca sp. SIO3C6]|nr:ammonium transporter [Symploca sp. SIO3C6]